MKHIVTTPPTLEPVTVEECRQFVGIHQAGDVSRDEVIKSRIRTARLWCESYTRYHFMRQTVTAYADCFEGCCNNCGIDLDAPLVSVNSVKYIDSNGVDTILAPAQYLVDAVSNRITPAYNTTWPTVRQQPNSVRIEYLAGVVTTAEVDERVKEAIKFIIGQWERYQNALEGGGYPPDFPNVAKSLLNFCFDMRGIF